MNRKDKNRLRSLKREIKRSGNKKVRSRLKKDLATNPDDAHLTQVDYGGRTSKKMNGIDYDSTRKKKTPRQLYDEEISGIMAEEQPGDGETAQKELPEATTTPNEAESLPAESFLPIQNEGQ